MTGLRKAAVIGAGTIGLSSTALFAGHGLDVWVYDPRPDLADAVREALTEFGPHLATQGLDVAGLAQRVHLTDDLELAVRDTDVVQENGPESVKFKQELFASLVDLTPRARVAAVLVFGDSGYSVHR